MLLKFNGTQIGDGLLAVTPGHEALTPARKAEGLFLDAASIVSLGRNMVRRLRCKLWLVRADADTLASYVSGIQELVETTGVVQVIKDDGTTVSFYSDATWRMSRCEPPELADGFAGRMTTNWMVEFEGATALI